MPKTPKPRRPSPLRPLFGLYPELVKAMDDVFTSHQFILHLAQKHQKLYIEALYEHRDKESPFGTIHGQLSNHLNKFPKLVEPLGKVKSHDIFGEPGQCAAWRKKAE